MASSEDRSQNIENAPSVSVSWLGTKSVSSKAILSETKHSQLFSNINKKARPTIKKTTGDDSAAH